MSLQEFSYKLGQQLNAPYSNSAMAQAEISGYHLPTPNDLVRANEAPPPDVVRGMTEADILQYEEEEEEEVAVVEEEEEKEEEEESVLSSERFKRAIAGTIYDFRHFDDIPGNTSEKVGYILRKDSRWMYFFGLFVISIIMFVVGANVAKWLFWRAAPAPYTTPPPPVASGGGAVARLPFVGSIARPNIFTGNLKIM